MKNIWKFLMVAMMAIAMVGCPQPQNNSTDNGGENGGSGSVYKGTVEADMIGTGWGADEGKNHTIKFVLVPKDVEFEGEDSFVDENKIYVYQHNSTGPNDGNGYIYYDQIPANGYIQPCNQYDASADNYAGVAVKKDGDNFVVYIDLSKITTGNLCAKGAAEGDKGEDKWGNFSKIATEYVPYFLGSVTANKYDATKNPNGYGDFDIDMWNAGVIKMTATSDAFPSNVQLANTGDAPTEVAIDWDNLTTLEGNFGAFALVNDSATFTWDGNMNWSKNDAGEVVAPEKPIQFAFHNDGWAYKFCGFGITALDTPVIAQGVDCVGAAGNAYIAEGVCEAGKTYKISFTRASDNYSMTVTLTEVEGSSSESSSSESSSSESSSSEVSSSESSSSESSSSESSSSESSSSEVSSSESSSSEVSSSESSSSEVSSSESSSSEVSSSEVSSSESSSSEVSSSESSSSEVSSSESSSSN